MATWNDDTLGAFGSASNIPTGEWFPVDTQTGQWGTPPPTLASDAGIPDIIPTRTMAPVPAMGGGFGGMPDQAPLSIGQASGTMAPMMTTPRSMQRVQRLDDLGALTPKPSVWEAIARGIGMASPEGRAMLQYSDQQQQQQLTNRLAARRQVLAEEQETRAATQDSLNTFLKISQMPNKTMRNLMFDRYVANYQQSTGQSLPADMVEAFKKSSLDEGQQMAKMLEPILAGTGIKTEVAMQYLQEGGDPKNLLNLMETGLKVKKEQREQQESQDLTQQLSTLGGASGVTAPATPTPLAPVTPTPATTARQPAAAVPSQAYTTAIDEAHKLYPQVRKALIPAIIAGESNWDAKAVSPKGAQGPMQLMPGTAKEMGVEDPFDITQNVRGGVRYYAQLLTKYKGNEALALAAYNAGPGAVDAVGGDLSKLPAETQKFVPAVLHRASAGGGAPTTTAQQPDTRMMVAGPGAPAPTQPAPPAATPQDQPRLTQLNQQIAAMDQFLAANIGRGSERTRAAVSQVERLRDNLTKERDQLTEPSRAGVRARTEAEIKADVEERVKGRQTAAEVLGERVTTFYDKATGEQESPGQSMDEMRSRLSGKKVAVLSTDQSKQLSVLKQLEPVLDGYKRLVEYAYGPKGPLKDFSRQPLETVSAMWDQAGQKDPQLQAMRRSLEGQLQSVVRALGARGDLNAQELEAAKQMLANFDASLGLGISAGAGLGRGGIGPMVGIKPTISVPDTPETGMRVANELVDLVNKRIGSLLGNPTYARTKLLEIPEAPPVNPDDPRYGFGMIPPEVMEAKQQRARQATQAPAQPPASGQRALQAMTPAQLRQLPDRLVQALMANPGMAAGLSPEQNGALMERLNQFEQQGAQQVR